MLTLERGYSSVGVIKPGDGVFVGEVELYPDLRRVSMLCWGAMEMGNVESLALIRLTRLGELSPLSDDDEDGGEGDEEASPAVGGRGPHFSNSSPFVAA